MDEKILSIVSAKLKRWEGQVINEDKLKEIRDEVYKKTKSNKFAPFSNIKKWIKGARMELKRAEKAEGKKAKPSKAAKAKPSRAKEEFHAELRPAPIPIPEISHAVENSVNELKLSSQPHMQEVPLPKPTIVFDKVYLQSIKHEVAGIRQVMERISRQLDKLEHELSSHRSDD
ncbi:Uncharacterised protein [Candidatus Anstonella stagnisolia]|nr:Uncharacterised protein [Candidatus Anstonella stagnisolia]